MHRAHIAEMTAAESAEAVIECGPVETGAIEAAGVEARPYRTRAPVMASLPGPPCRADAPARIPAIMPAAPGLAVTANAAIVVVRAAAPASSPIAGTPIAAGGPADTEASAEARRPAVIIAIIDDHGRRGRRGIGLASIGTEADITRRHPAGAVAAIDLAPAVAAGDRKSVV